jgi:hypothetical protein
VSAVLSIDNLLAAGHDSRLLFQIYLVLFAIFVSLGYGGIVS